MTSYGFLIIFGATLMIPTLALGDTNVEADSRRSLNIFLDYDVVENCEDKAEKLKRSMHRCNSKEFTEEEMNATMALHEDTRFLRSKHFCRKKNEILHCIRETADAILPLSNKSEIMVPFVKGLVEDTILTLCDNDGELLNVFLDDKHMVCALNVPEDCRDRLEGAFDLTEVAFCNYRVPDVEDPLTQQFFCQKFLAFLECSEVKAETCSVEMKAAVKRLIYKWRNETSCSKHL